MSHLQSTNQVQLVCNHERHCLIISISCNIKCSKCRGNYEIAKKTTRQRCMLTACACIIRIVVLFTVTFSIVAMMGKDGGYVAPAIEFGVYACIFTLAVPLILLCLYDCAALVESELAHPQHVQRSPYYAWDVYCKSSSFAYVPEMLRRVQAQPSSQDLSEICSVSPALGNTQQTV